MTALYHPYLNHGFVALIDSMGDDTAIDNAARMSHNAHERLDTDKNRLIRYLIKHDHTSPLEMVEFKFHIRLPIFVMRQLVRHRTANLNEVSARYTKLPAEFYIPSQLFTQDTANKQKSSRTRLSEGEEQSLIAEIATSHYAAYKLYEKLLDMGVSRETSRQVLPVAIFTECFWKIDLHNFLKFAKNRLGDGAQDEIQQLARIMFDEVKLICPIAYNAFIEEKGI